jgi:hypothetical protein
MGAKEVAWKTSIAADVRSQTHTSGKKAEKSPALLS